MKISVLVPTYRRPDILSKCLEGIDRQTRRADEVIVVVREDDVDSQECGRQWQAALPIVLVQVTELGVVAAMNAGMAVAGGEVVALTDDDAIPFPDWLKRIEHAFEQDPKLGALGGRDIIHQADMVGLVRTQTVGRIAWTGKVVGDHHRGEGRAREVDHLKGVNMSWRNAASGRQPFDTDFRGQGAQVFFELAFCFDLLRAGWKIVYDPDLLVDHFPAVRHDTDQRSVRSLEALENAAFNFNLALLRHMRRSPSRMMAILWAGLVGTAEAPGSIRHWMRWDVDPTQLVVRRQLAQRAAADAASLVRRDRQAQR